MDNTATVGDVQQTLRRAPRRLRQGRVMGDANRKTIRVQVDYNTKHELYGKYIRRRTILHAHDEQGQAKKGDLVEVMECRPISKTKTWRLVRILGKG